MTLIIVTFLSLAIAATMSVIAWRLLSEERRRSGARVARLAADIRDDELPLSTPEATTAASADMFAVVQPEPQGFRTVATVALGVFVVSTAVALVVVLSSGSGRTSRGGPAEHPSGTSSAPASTDRLRADAAPTVASAPLELVTLQHERDAERLTVRGIIRNPSTGLSIDHLAAVVLLFNADGAFIMSGRAEVAAGTLAPGGETTFAVTVPNAANVGRYRVSFRTEDRIVPHIDRRT